MHTQIIGNSTSKIEDDVYFDPNDTIYLPHYGQNIILDQILDITLKKQRSTLKGSSVSLIDDDIPFHIPVKIWVYRNDNGSNQALSEDDVQRLFNEVNRIYKENNTGIQFYLRCAIQYVNSTKFNTIDSDNEFNDMLATYHTNFALNWHLVHSTTTTWAGKAVFPWKKNNLRFAIEYGGWLSPSKIGTTAHEIGHTLGLLHTHENTRGTGNYNGDAANCFQESVSRSMTQGIGCTFTMGKKKCEVNGDALCDTEAAPNKENAKWITINSSCNYTSGGSDNWGAAWKPPVNNYMSYLSNELCRSEFTQGQIAVMHSYILLYMNVGGFDPYGLSIPWYNLQSIELRGSVNNRENESFIVPQIIEVAPLSNTYTINSGATVNLFAGESIMLNHGFHAKAGSVFTAKSGNLTGCTNILPSSKLKSVSSYSMPIGVLNQEDIDECISILNKALNREYGTTEERNDDLNSYNIYPNPTKGLIHIDSYDNIDCYNVRIYDSYGKLIFNKNNLDNNTIDISNNPNGIYLLIIENDQQIIEKKIVLQK